MFGLKYVLSFDAADKTLGVCLMSYMPKITIDEQMELLVNEKNNVEKLKLISTIINNIIRIRSCWLFDLLPENIVRETPDSIRLSRLKYALKSIRKSLDDAKITLDHIIVEYQMGQNDLSRLISAGIMYEFVEYDANIHVNIGLSTMLDKKTNDILSSNCITIGPTFKNSIQFSPELSYSNFAAKYKTTKTANKHHTAENFKYFLTLNGISQKNKHSEINHIADAFMQSVYWIIHNDQ